MELLSNVESIPVRPSKLVFLISCKILCPCSQVLGPFLPLRSPQPTPSSTSLYLAFLRFVTNKLTFFLIKLLNVLIRRLTVSNARAALAEMVAELAGSSLTAARDQGPPCCLSWVRDTKPRKKSRARLVPYWTILSPVMLIAPNSATVVSHLSSRTRPDMR